MSLLLLFPHRRGPTTTGIGGGGGGWVPKEIRDRVAYLWDEPWEKVEPFAFRKKFSRKRRVFKKQEALFPLLQAELIFLKELRDVSGRQHAARVELQELIEGLDRRKRRLRREITDKARATYDIALLKRAEQIRKQLLAKREQEYREAKARYETAKEEARQAAKEQDEIEEILALLKVLI